MDSGFGQVNLGHNRYLYHPNWTPRHAPASVKYHFLSRDATHSVERGIPRQVVRLSVCPSVTLRYRGHIGWNTSKIISWLISLGCSLSAVPNITDLLHGDHHENQLE